MKQSYIVAVFLCLFSCQSGIYASSEEADDIISTHSSTPCVALEEKMGDMLDDNAFKGLLPYIERISVNGAEPYSFEGEKITLENLEQAQRMGWIVFHMTLANAFKLAENNWPLAVRLEWPNIHRHILEKAYTSA